LAHKPRALFLSPEPPYPTIGGGALRSASLLEYLARGYEVDVILFRHSGQPAPLCPPAHRLLLVDLKTHARHGAARARRNAVRLLRGAPPLVDRFSGYGEQIRGFLAAQRYDVGVIEHFWCAAYVAELGTVCRRTVLDLHNIESAWHERCASAEPWPFSAMLRRFGASALKLEREWLPRFSVLLASSEADAVLAARIAPSVPITVYPNALPLVPEPQHNVGVDVIVFAGNLEYLPNVQAVNYFHTLVWPLLRARRPALVWRLIGKNPHGIAPSVRADSNVELTGPVEDAIAAMARGKLAVVPVISGSGTRLKILEAWAAGIPVVSTAFGAEGLGATPGEHLLIASDPAEFAERVLELLDDPVRRSVLGAAGRAFYERNFTWRAVWPCLEKAGF